jgi:hypothetical protein
VLGPCGILNLAGLIPELEGLFGGLLFYLCGIDKGVNVMRTCPRCRAEKPAEGFYRDCTRPPNGRYRLCKECHKRLVTARRARMSQAPHSLS